MIILDVRPVKTGFWSPVVVYTFVVEQYFV